MDMRIGWLIAPALGDVRALGEGDTVWLTPESTQRDDWPRYLDALAAAIAAGTDVRWLR